MVGMFPGMQPWSRMSIARKEFRAIANAIGRSGLSPIDRAVVAEALSKALIELNPSFDPERFFIAATGFPRATWLAALETTPPTEGEDDHG